MSRWPIRIRLTAAFVAAMAVVLVAVGAFVYLRLADSLDDAIDSGLGSRSDELAALVQQPGFDLEGGSTVGDEAESFAQVMRADRTVVAASAVVGGRPVLTAGELERASREPVFLERARLGGFDDGVRLLAVPVTGRDLVVVVGSSPGCSSSSVSAGRLRSRSPHSSPTPWPLRRCGPWRRCGARRRRSAQANRAGACRCRRRATRSLAWGRR
jgi:hypothetical protein